MKPNLARRLTSEALGTAILLATVVGSGIMGERLADGNVAVALPANTLATGAILVALILTFGNLFKSGSLILLNITVLQKEILPLSFRQLAISRFGLISVFVEDSSPIY